MRKIIVNTLLVIALFAFFVFYWYVGTAEAAMDHYLQEERDLGNGYKLCIYDQGITITVKSHELCPLRIRE
jgi:hypothetical protein